MLRSTCILAIITRLAPNTNSEYFSMRKRAICLTLFLGSLASLPLFADSIELADGTVLEGDFIGSSNGIIMFDTGDGIEAYPENNVIGVFFSSGVATAQAAAPQNPSITVPAGTKMTIRTVESVDSRSHGIGHKFRGQLEGALVVGGVTVAPRGAFVYGVVSSSSQAGNLAGSSQLSLEFTSVMIDDQLYPIATTALSARSQAEGGRTLGRTARAAAIGGLIDGSKGARTGAKVGAGVSILTGGATINVPRGTLIDTSLRTPLVIN